VAAPLQRNAFIAALAPPELTLLAKYLSPLDLSVGQLLHTSGNVVADVIFPHSGLIVQTIRQRDDGAAGVALVGRDGIVGGFEATASTPASSDAEVHIAGGASRMPASIFRQLLESHPDIRRFAARFDSAVMAQAQQTAYCNAIHPIEARLCRLLSEVLDRSNEDWIPLNQATLAEILSARRTTVTLIIGRLETAGVLKWRRGYVDILDRAELARRSCGCYARIRHYVDRLIPAAGESKGAAAIDQLSLKR